MPHGIRDNKVLCIWTAEGIPVDMSRRRSRQMRILLIRHGDPDYVNDTITKKGHREAALLAETAEDLQLGECYVSPLGRARDTASYSLKKTGKTAETLDWLREFPAVVDINQSEELQRAYPNAKKIPGEEQYAPRIVWDMVPGYWMEHPEYMDQDAWRESEAAKYGDVVSVYDSVIRNFDAFLASQGYVREGGHYRVEKETTKTVTFFCHFGISCVLMSHLWNISPFVLWHTFAMLPTSVTEIVTEEREQGTAFFRGLRIGDLSHLYAGGEKPSFAVRFCEVFSDKDERH